MSRECNIWNWICGEAWAGLSEEIVDKDLSGEGGLAAHATC